MYVLRSKTSIDKQKHYFNHKSPL